MGRAARMAGCARIAYVLVARGTGVFVLVAHTVLYVSCTWLVGLVGRASGAQPQVARVCVAWRRERVDGHLASVRVVRTAMAIVAADVSLEHKGRAKRFGQT